MTLTATRPVNGRGKAFDPSYEVLVDGRVVGVIYQDRSARPLCWQATKVLLEPYPDFPEQRLGEWVGWDTDKYSAAALLIG